jgi:ubiquinone/menaquinone biosynthesis C-methylase UbiE
MKEISKHDNASEAKLKWSQEDAGRLKKWCEHIDKYRIPVYKELLKSIPISGKGLELGSGSSWFSINASRLPSVESIFAVDNDRRRLEVARDYFMKIYNGDEAKVRFINCDFHKLDLPSSHFDFIFCDAALHHSDNIALLLKEIRRMLKPDGTFIAIREPILPENSLLKLFRYYTFGLRQRMSGDIENIYSAKKWEYYFKNAGFTLEFEKYQLNTTTKEKFLSKLRICNGYLFNRKYLIARPV